MTLGGSPVVKQTPPPVEPGTGQSRLGAMHFGPRCVLPAGSIPRARPRPLRLAPLTSALPVGAVGDRHVRDRGHARRRSGLALPPLRRNGGRAARAPRSPARPRGGRSAPLRAHGDRLDQPASRRGSLVPVLAVLIYTVVMISYDEFVFHRPLRPVRDIHAPAAPPAATAWQRFLATWAHWCFVRELP